MPALSPYIVVMGASRGGIEALTEVIAGLPADLPAAVLVVQHLNGRTPSALASIFATRATLDVRLAVHGEVPRPRRVYVAPPDVHIMLRDGLIHVVRGPAENGFRPAIDVLFRTAAAAYGPRVVGVLLTGDGDCGSAGLVSIQSRNGVVIVEDPVDATAPAMPRNALGHVRADHIAPLAAIPGLIVAATLAPARGWPEGERPGLASLEGERLGERVEIVCPLCDGALTVSQLDGLEVFRCHVGHAFSLDRLGTEQHAATERALWAAVRALEDSAASYLRLASRGDQPSRERFQASAEQQAANAEVIRRILLEQPPRSGTE
jgi:two-component system chemotaxis response regulator CheB